MKQHESSVWVSFCVILLTFFTFSRPANAQSASLAPSKRVVINLGETPWKYLKDQDPANAAAPSFDDSSWISVGVPYSADQATTFLNEESGGSEGDLGGGKNWYRKHFTMDAQYAHSKVFVEFEGAHTGAQVYINGTFIPGNSAINPKATHVVGFVPFLVDLTPYLKFDGSDNVLAVKVSKTDSFFEDPGFSGAFRFGQGDTGIFRPVYMYITDQVHIPQNDYAGIGTWGTYVSTLTASSTSATVDVQTNVLNEGPTDQLATLTVQIVDAAGNVVAAQQSTQTIPSNIGPGLHPQLFDQTLTVNNPTLWYPNNSMYGKPYLYKVFHTVSINGVVIDALESPLGIRTITWDKDQPFINGMPHHLWGGSGRYDYPALGTTVPAEQQWRDLQLLAAAGGNLYRPGHSPQGPEFIAAADALGIMVIQPSGDGENAFAAHCSTPPCDMQTLKSELHRDMIIRYRNNPSILAWEADNGVTDTQFAKSLKALSLVWDPIQQRVQADRTPDAANGDILGCTLEGCEVGVKQQFPNNPAWGSEYWGTGSARFSYDYELAYAAPFLDNWRKGVAAKAFGMVQWYFADTPGESIAYVEGTQPAQVRNIGSSMVDINRFPRLQYYIYKAAWTPYAIKPVVALAHHWNRSGEIRVNAFSNCPAVRLLINGVPQGTDQIPNPWNSDSSANLTQTTTKMPFQVSWDVNWVAGTVTAECLDQFGAVQATDQKLTAGFADHVQLDVVPDVVRPDGTSFAVTANGSDAAFVVAKIVDANGVVVPTADNNITFSVSGPATYMGGSQSLVTAGQPITYHAPGDHELQTEGGLQKIALRSQFTPGTVTVTATSPGLGSGSTTLTIQPIVQSQPTATAPSIIAQPVNMSVTVGQPAHFSVTASGAAPLGFQWLQNNSVIGGATSATYDTPATSISDNGTVFSVVVTNSLGTATSSAASLSVFPAATPTITAQPLSQVVVVGQTAQFSVAATGSPTLQYQWQRNGVVIPGAIAPVYTTPTLTGADNGEVFTVTVTNPVGTVTSAVAMLSVNAAIPPSITTQPISITALPGQPATFSVTVAGSAPMQFQWQKDGNNIAINSPTLTVNSVQASDAGAYVVTATNIAGSVTSAPAMLTLAPPGVNLSLGKIAKASSYENEGAMPANAVLDGDLTTRWGSAFSDPQWVQVDLGSVMAFNRIILRWQGAYATQYQIQVSNDGNTWTNVYEQDSGTGANEDFTFQTTRARYVRMYGMQRVTGYGYSLYEFEIYNAASCGSANERYTTIDLNTVVDNLSQLQWSRKEFTLTTQGAQLTQPLAAQYCTDQGMRLPTRDEALAISGSNSASCAFPSPWNTWSSTFNPQDNTFAYWVSSSGNSNLGVATNLPGWALCTKGSTVVAPTITDSLVNMTANVGSSAQFGVVAVGSAPITYEWMKNGIPVALTGVPSYATPPVVATDNNAQFSVLVTGGNGLSVTSGSAILAVTDNPTTGTGNNNNGNNNGNTNNTDTAQTGFGVGAVPTGPNLALGKTATSSGDESVAFQPNQAIDGDLTTRWSSAFSDPSWIQIDLGSAQSIGQVVLRWERAFSVAYQIQVSTDMQNWTTISTRTNGQGGLDNLVFPAINGRYIRMYGTQRSSQYGNSLWEFEVYGPVLPTIVTQPASQTAVAGAMAQFTVVASGNGPFNYAWLRDGSAIPGATSTTYTTPLLSASDSGSQFSVTVSNASGSATSSAATLTVINPVPGIANLAIGKPVTSSGNENDGLGAFNAVDGDLTTRWSSAFVDPSWLEVDLGSPMIINKVVLRWEASYGKAYQIQVSNDEQTWTTVYTQTAGPGGLETLTFPSVIDRYIRLYGTARATQYGYSLYEFEVYGADVPSIVAEPLSQTVTAGATATFTVTAGGHGPFSYQWLRNGVAVPGATASSYTTPAVSSSDNGSIFSVSVTNATGSTTSSKATLIVNSVAPTGTNLALNRPVKESGSQDDAALGAANAVDGNLTTRWSSSFIDPSWIEVDLGAPKTVSQVVLRWENAYGTAYQIQVSNDEKNWTTAYTQNAGTGGVENITFPPVSGRYIRMFGQVRATQYGYSLFEFEVYSAANAPTINTQPANQTANVGSTATFTVSPAGTPPFTYQWLKNGTAIPGATAASYTTPVLAATDNGGAYSVTIGNASGTVTSAVATLTVNNSGSGYTIYPGFIGVDLNNNTKGAWADNQVYVTVMGLDPATGIFAYVKSDGTIVDAKVADNDAAGHLTKNGQNYPNYAFTLSQSKLLKLPKMDSGRVFISLGEPVYLKVLSDANGNIGYAGPNPQNAADPNVNVHFDWYEFTYNSIGVFINTTQVDEFGLPLLLDVWGQGGTFHQQTGITESIAMLDQEYANETPAEFHTPAVNNLRIMSPTKTTFGLGGTNGSYFDTYIANVWSNYSTTPITIDLFGGSRRFTGTTSASSFNFTEVNLNNGAFGGNVYTIAKPTTQDILQCSGSMANGNPNSQDVNTVELAIEAQFCAAFNRHDMLDVSTWATPTAWYSAAPANYYAQFWHKHSVGGLAYGFAYDDVSNQSSTITTGTPEHMAFGIGW